MADPKVRADRTLGPALVKAFEESKRRSAGPALPRARDRPARSAAAGRRGRRPDAARSTIPDSETRISVIWALGSSGDPAVVRDCCRSIRRRTRTPASARWWSTRSARCRATRRSTRCGRRCRTRAPDVRWNAAVALARHGRSEGVAVLRQMLDRGYVEQTVKRDVRQDDDQDPIADVMISGIARRRGAQGRSRCKPRSRRSVSRIAA